MEARLFVSPRCFVCRWMEPVLKAWFWRRGIRLGVYKLHDGHAFQVNGEDVVAVDRDIISGTPALQIGRVVVIGSGILAWLREASRR